MNWYDELKCSVCARPLAETRHQGRPLLRDAGGATVEPHRHTAEQIAALRERATPICWACNLEAAFEGTDTHGTGVAPKPRLDENWWVGSPCDVCATPLRRGWFWREPPRAVGHELKSYDVRSIDPASCSGPEKRFIVACTDCYRNHYDRVTKAVRALGAPAVAPAS